MNLDEIYLKVRLAETLTAEEAAYLVDRLQDLQRQYDRALIDVGAAEHQARIARYRLDGLLDGPHDSICRS